MREIVATHDHAGEGIAWAGDESVGLCDDLQAPTKLVEVSLNREHRMHVVVSNHTTCNWRAEIDVDWGWLGLGCHWKYSVWFTV